MLILDLQSEQFPQYGRLESYYGHPFIWCMLHNFGGTLGMFGSAEIVNQVYREDPLDNRSLDRKIDSGRKGERGMPVRDACNKRERIVRQRTVTARSHPRSGLGGLGGT